MANGRARAASSLPAVAASPYNSRMVALFNLTVRVFAATRRQTTRDRIQRSPL